MRVYGSSTSGQLDGYTDADGVFERRVLNGEASAFFGSPPGGTYVIQDGGGRSSRVAAKGGVEKVTLYAPSRLHPLVAIKGHLQLPDGSPAAGVKIGTANNIARYHTATFTGSGSAYARTNPDGSFELADVPRDAEVFLYAQTKDHTYILAEVLDPIQASPELARPLVMREGLQASVLLADASGKPRANMALKILPRMWGNHLFRADDRPVATDAEGRLNVHGIVPGLEYFIRDAQANLGESGWWNRYNENRVLLAAEGSPTAPATPPPAAQQANGEISGAVVDPKGKPIAEAYVTVENKDLLLLPEPMKIGAQIRQVIRPDSTQTDAQGQPLQGIDIAFYSAARPRSGAACQSTNTTADGTWSCRFPPGEVYVYVRTTISGTSWRRKSYTYNMVAGQTIEGVDFVLDKPVPENSPYRGVSTAAATQEDRKTSLPPGATAGAKA